MSGVKTGHRYYLLFQLDGKKEFGQKDADAPADFEIGKVSRAPLTLSPPSTTVVSYANSLDLDDTSSNSASHPIKVV